MVLLNGTALLASKSLFDDGLIILRSVWRVTKWRSMLMVRASKYCVDRIVDRRSPL